MTRPAGDTTSGRSWRCGGCGEDVPSRELQAHLLNHSAGVDAVREALAEVRRLGLADVAMAAATLDEARRSLDEAVAAARNYGASWADVGKAAGITRSSAQERWGGPRT